MNEMTQVAGEYTSPFKSRYDNFIGGKFVAPVKGQYFDNITPITGAKVCEVARSTAEDVELALDAAHAAKDAWGRTSAAERSNILLKIADRIEENLDLIATAETWDNGKPIRETTAADIPLSVIDHFPLFRGRPSVAGRQHVRDRPRHRGLSLPRTAGRRGADHPVELFGSDGRLEAGAGAGGGQLHRSQTRRTDPGCHYGPGSK